MIGFALVGSERAVGDRVDVKRGALNDPATLCELPFY